MRKWILAGVVMTALVVGYVVWPFVGLAQLGYALHQRDADDALRLIDVAAVRRSILNQVLDEGTKSSDIERRYGRIGRSLAVGFAVSTLDRQFAQVIDDGALRRLIAEGRFPEGIEKTLGQEAQSRRAGTPSLAGLPENPFRAIRGWRFRSPVTFEVTIGETGERADWTTLRLRRSGLRWRLTALELPGSVVDRITPVIRDRIGKATA